MENQNNQKKWYEFIIDSAPAQMNIAVAGVFPKNVVVKTDRPVFTYPKDPKKMQKVFLEGDREIEDEEVFIKFKKLPDNRTEYHEISMRFLIEDEIKLGRKSEPSPFDIRNRDRDFKYCFLRIYPKSFFEGVFVEIGHKAYKLSVKENSDSIKVLLWSNPKNLPACLR